MSLRAVSVDDPVARELLTAYFHARQAGFADQNVVYSIRFPDAAVFTPPAGVFVVVDDEDGAPVGCGGIRHLPDGPLGARYEVKHLYLKPETRGRGWGRLLLDDLEERAIRFGARELVLDTHHTLTAAGGLYASAGFALTAPYNDNPNASRWYGKPVGRAQTG